jgi:glycosidase
MRQWKESLQRIKSLGFNAVQILPITELDVSESPYSAKDFFNIDPAFLDPNDRRDGLSQFEDFVEEAARLGLRLCVDLVLNHVGASSKIVKLRPQWIAPDISQPDGMKRAGCWIGTNWHTWGDLVLINYEHPDEDVRHDIWTYMAQYAHFWAYYAHYTGGLVRFDNLHSSDPAFVSVLCKSLRTRFPNLTFLVEFFTDHNTLIERAYEWNLNLLLGTPWEHKFVPQLRGFLDYTHRVFNKTRFITPLSSHDSGSPAQEFGNPNSTIPRYVMCALGGCGATGIVQGVEWGIQSKINFIGRNGTLPPGSGHDYSDLIRRVNAMLAEYPAFQRGGNTKFIDNNHNAIIACLREVTGQDSKFIVVANFDVTDGQWISLDLAVHFPKARELLVESLLYPNLPSRTTSRLELPMPPCGAQVFRVTPVG